ncbi:hypothetical protein FA95DRAFT_1566584 [Auriscalpium vulgare]|uniref:Uncharacterized protein n=1 Tax=Auriscalpium vulgare TaxID=40419 RepID=A0ACB8R8W9_9AGAM|nr:hypothetical protein FA95DRAFT_1566584 [Auriscalpium vulgare]
MIKTLTATAATRRDAFKRSWGMRVAQRPRAPRLGSEVDEIAEKRSLCVLELRNFVKAPAFPTTSLPAKVHDRFVSFSEPGKEGRRETERCTAATRLRGHALPAGNASQKWKHAWARSSAMRAAVNG